jgi:hypothetical protein
MKKIGIITLMLIILLQAYGQEAASTVKKENQKTDTLLKSEDDTRVVIGKDFFSIDEGKDNVNIRLGNHGINILESLEGGSKITIKKYNNDDWVVQDDRSDNSDNHRRYRNHFKGHWAGIEWGFANYLTSDYSFVMPNDIYYMNLYSSKSYYFDINFMQLSLGFSRHFGLVTGLGLNWDCYRFDGDNSIQVGNNGVIEEYPSPTPLKKSKLKTLYLNVPLLLEGQIPVDNHHINIAAGVIGGVKLWSQTKMVSGSGEKLKNTDDFSMNLLRWGPTVRIGYGCFQIVSTYYVTPLFKKGKSPGGHDLSPFEIGFALTFNG